MLLLAGDLGATKTLLALARQDRDQLLILAEEELHSSDWPDFSTLVQHFLSKQNQSESNIDAACFGVAGPITEESGGLQTAKITNLPWVIKRRQLENDIETPACHLMNDFAAIAEGIDQLKGTDIQALTDNPVSRAKVKAIIGAGSGLGHAILVDNQGTYETLNSEAGHIDFAPMNQEQTEISRYFLNQGIRPTWEFLVSGPGLLRLFDYIQKAKKITGSNELLEALESEPHPALISQAGLSGKDEAAEKTLNLFAQLYGSAAGNLALASLPVGGLYIAGGIAHKIMDKTRIEYFLDSFYDRPAMKHILKTIPVKLITNPKVGLLGAIAKAATLSDQ